MLILAGLNIATMDSNLWENSSTDEQMKDKEQNIRTKNKEQSILDAQRTQLNSSYFNFSGTISDSFQLLNTNVPHYQTIWIALKPAPALMPEMKPNAQLC